VLRDLCESHDVIALQEHWLSDCNLSEINNIHNNFVAISKSAMSERLQRGVLCGRPFGGLAVLARKSLVHSLTLLAVDSACRCLAELAKLHTGHVVLIVNVYLPCFSANSDYESAINDCVGFIENCLVCYDYNSAVLLGDFNFECDIRNSG